KEFVDAVLDSIESIASGGVGAVAGLVEGALAKAVPMVIGFLASLLGLGGIVVKAGKNMLAKMGKKKNKKKDKDTADSAKVKADALTAATARLKGMTK